MSGKIRTFKKLRCFMAVLFIALMTFSLFACGSGGGGGGSAPGIAGGGGSFLTGVAATGAPVAFGNVTVKDSTGAVIGTTTTAADGSYSLDVTGFSPPYYIYATDGVNELYSVAFDDGLANVNPATNLTLALIFGADLEDVFDDPAGNPVTQGELETAGTMIDNAIGLIFDAYDVADVNPFTDPFVADGTGLDRLFDDLKVEIDPAGNVTFENPAGDTLGETTLDNINNSVPLSDEIGIVISGNGGLAPGGIPSVNMILLSVSSLSTSGDVRYSNLNSRLLFVSKSITNVSTLNGVITITGTGEVDGIPGYTFSATVEDINPDVMSITIFNSDNSIFHSSGAQQINEGNFNFVLD